MDDNILHIPGGTSEEDAEDEAALKPVTIMLPEDVIQIIDQVAEDEGLTRSSVLRGLLTYAIEAGSEDEAKFTFTVKRRPDDRIQVEIGSTSEDLTFWQYATAFLLRTTAEKMGVSIEEALRLICDKALDFESLLIPMRRR